MQSKTTTFSLIALCAVLGMILLWRVSAAGSDKKALAARVDALTQELAVAKQQAAAAAAHQPVAPVETKQPVPVASVPSESAQRAASSASIAKLNEDLAAARSRISELESKILSLDADRATLAQQRQQELTGAEETCRTKIAETQQSLAALQADLKASQQRAALFESENDNLRKAQATAAKTPAHSPTSGGELDELSRRRDTYLKSLIRRYREIDNDYRAFMRDPQGPHANDPAILRIQAALSQAEEDLRQIDSLNAKTLLVEKRQEKN